MREILFRGKKLAGNEWVYGFYVHSSGGTSFKDLSGETAFHVHDFIMVPGDSENSVEGFPVVPDTVGQFTGMKDKHGVSIYEGDIVLKRTYNRTATLGSLFDGISGFPLAWARYNGPDACRWSSEIEEFPIAVCKKHFGDEDTGETGDIRDYL